LFLSPNLEIPPRPSDVDMRIRRADDRFRRGKQMYDQGDVVEARVEFDAAIDILLTTPDQLPDRYKIEAKLEQLVAAIFRYDVNRLGAGDLSGQLAWDKAPLEDILDLTFPIDPNLTPRVKEQLAATASQLPLEINDAVLSYINYFSTERGRRTLLAGLRRAGRYKPMISRILAEEGVPQELIYLAQAESGFLPRAVSHKSAVGMWQFIRARGREYGLNQTAYHDDRLDPEKATRSAARHLKDLYQRFGDWYLAIAGYNCGDGCVERAVQRTGYADFWEVRARRALPRETTNYVPIIVAMSIMHKNAKDYGLEDIEVDPPLEYETFTLEAATHLGLIADSAERPVSEVRELNPALLTNVAPAGYDIHVPPGTRTQVLATLGTIPAARRASWRIHRVSEGDTLDTIARRYRMPVSAIEAANSTTDTEVGDVLIIPTASQLERASVKSGRAKSGKRTAASPRTKSGRSSATRSNGKSSSRARSVVRRTGPSGLHTAGLRQ
jgi:membrane-bound lytic murein transglycosylase D